MTPVATITCVSPESHDCNCAFLASSSRWAWRWAVLTHATLLAIDATRSINCRVKQYTVALSVLEDTSQSHSTSCRMISSSTSTTSSTTYPINGRTVDIRMTVSDVDITILRSVSWEGDKEAVNVTSWHPTAHNGNMRFMTGLKSDKSKCASSTTTQWSFCRWFNVCVSSTNLGVVARSTDTNKMDGGSSNVIVSVP